MFVNTIQQAKGSIFPIILTLFKNGSYVDRQVAGTGFFIDEEGHFVTALHVVAQTMNTGITTQYGSLGNVPHASFSNKQPELIVEIGKLPELDLFVGKLSETKQSPLKIWNDNPPEGSAIVIGGYPFPNILKAPNGALNFITVRQYWQSTMIMDYINLDLFNIELPYNGFLVDKRTIPGMSGGPALDVHGNVIGMCTAQITRTAQDKVPHINGVCLDGRGLKAGIDKIFGQLKIKN